MLNKIKTNSKFLLPAIALIAGVSSIQCLAVQAQTQTSDSDLLRNIQIGKDEEWNFSGENESLSLQDDIEALGEYSVTESDPELREDNKEWGNTGDVKNHSVEFEIYDY